MANPAICRALNVTLYDLYGEAAPFDPLSERERKLIYLRYFKGLTQVKTAQILGVSQVQVSRLEKKAIAFLRWQLADG